MPSTKNIAATLSIRSLRSGSIDILLAQPPPHPPEHSGPDLDHCEAGDEARGPRVPAERPAPEEDAEDARAEEDDGPAPALRGWRAVLKRATFLLAAVGLGILFMRWVAEPGDWPGGIILGLAVVEVGPAVLRWVRGRLGGGV